MLNLIPVGRLIIAADQAYRRGVICKLVRAMNRYAVVGEQGVEDWAQHTALWYPSVGLCDMDKKKLSRFFEFFFDFDLNHDFDTNRHALQL